MALKTGDQETLNQQIQNQKEPIATNIKGAVKWFNRLKGFGFITRDDTKEDVFSHHSSIKPFSINLRRLKRRLFLIEQERVEFDVVKAPNGLEAVNIVGKDGYLVLDIIAIKRDIPSFDLKIINEGRVTGKVKWFNVKIKYGFIHCDYNNEDVFVHSSAIIKNNPNKYKASLSEGEPVEFDILKRADGKLEAVNVSGPDGACVVGSRYSPDKINRAEQSDKTYVEENVAGKVKWFNVKAGFGFISRSDNDQDVYAHYTAIANKNPDHRVRSLADGEAVQFNIVEGSKGAEASDITGVNGEAVQGSEYARPRRDTSAKGSRSTSRPGKNRQSRRPPNRTDYDRDDQAPRMPRNNLRMNRRPVNYQNGYAMNRGMNNNFIPNQFGPNGPVNYQNRPRRPNYGNMPPLMTNSVPPYQPQIRMPAQQYPLYNNNPRYVNGNNSYINPALNQNNNFRPQQNAYYYQGNEQNQLPPNMRFVDRRVHGIAKWYNYKNGFGFVTRTDSNLDIFVHKSGIQATDKAVPSLDDGESVEFDVIQDGNKLLAINVTGPNGSVLRGSKYAPSLQIRQSRSRNEVPRSVNSGPRPRNNYQKPREN